MNTLKRVIDISYNKKLTHLSSVLTSLPVIEKIYEIKKDKDIFVLGNSHAALALWVVLESKGLCNAEEMVDKYGTHAFRDIEHGIYVSGGSLGQAETIAVGMALADRSKTVYLMTSDGACAEGSIWETLRIAHDLNLNNLKVVVIANGQGATGEIDVDYLENRLRAFFPVVVIKSNLGGFPESLKGIKGHYNCLSLEDYVKFQ